VRLASRSRIDDLLTTANDTVVLVAFGAGALSKLVDPRPAFESVDALFSAPLVSASVVIMLTTGELALALARPLRLLSPRTAHFAAALTLVVFTIYLLVLRSTAGSDAMCGCMAALVGTPIDAAIFANSVLIVELLLVLAYQARRGG